MTITIITLGDLNSFEREDDEKKLNEVGKNEIV